MRKLSLLFFSSLLFVSTAYKVYAANITTDTTWSGDVAVTEDMQVTAGTTLTVEKGTHITLSPETKLEINGILDVRGTVLDPVVIDGEKYAIEALDNGKMTIRDADISGGGEVFPSYVDAAGHTHPEAHIGAVTAAGKGKVEVQATKFHDNEVATMAELTSVQTGRLVVQRSNFENNTRFDAVNYNPQVRHEFSYNWWGNPSGPNPSKLFKNFSTDYPRASAELRDPVIIVPGILGSDKKDGVWYLDKIRHIYDNLVASFEANGYTLNQDLYIFPYDWFQSNTLTANDLRDKIQEIRSENNYWPKVDIVAHSMGGLVARQYIEGNQYNNDVDQLITLGTPHNGSPEAYLTWEGGSFGLDSTGKILNTVFQAKARLEGYQSVFDLVRNLSVPSVKELLPIYSYLKESGSGDIREYPNNYPLNDFLDSLATPAKLVKLKLTELTNIVGDFSNSESTISTIRVEDVGAGSGEEWEHGKPENYDNNQGDHGLEYGSGDGTVPLSSVQNIPSDQEFEFDAAHTSLPTVTQCEVLEVLIAIPTSSCTYIDTWHVPNLLYIGIFSPIDVQVVSPSGKRVGKNFETGGEYDEIEGAFYSGYNTDEEFVTIPNPEDGEYKILTQGTGDGEYRIQVSKISEGDTPSDEAKESTVNIEGTAQTGAEEEKHVTVSGDEVLEKLPDTEAPQITITTPAEQEYLNDGSINFAYEVSDNVSLPENITTETTLDGAVTTDTAKDSSLLSLGEHTFEVKATDEAGNSALQTVTFSVATSFEALKNNIGHYTDLELIKKPSVENFLSREVEKLAKLLKLKEHLNKVPWYTRWWLELRIDRQIHKREALIERYINLQVRRGNLEGSAGELLKASLRQAVGGV